MIKISVPQLWEPEAVHDPMDVGIGARLAAVVELVIAQYQWLFQVGHFMIMTFFETR